MDKVKINNQIILMRKLVHQAKVLVLRKIIKSIKMLKSKKGTETQLKKNERKVELFYAIMKVVKNFQADIVSKKSLLKEKDWEKVISDKSSTVEDRALAYIASSKSIQKEVAKFRASEPKLVSVLPDLLMEWEQKEGRPDRIKSLPSVKRREKSMGKPSPGRKVQSCNAKKKRTDSNTCTNNDTIEQVDGLDVPSAENEFGIDKDVDGVQDIVNGKSKDIDSCGEVLENKERVVRNENDSDSSRLSCDDRVEDEPIGVQTARVKNDPFFGGVEEDKEMVKLSEKCDSSPKVSIRNARGNFRARGSLRDRGSVPGPYAAKQHNGSSIFSGWNSEKKQTTSMKDDPFFGEVDEKKLVKFSEKCDSSPSLSFRGGGARGGKFLSRDRFQDRSAFSKPYGVKSDKRFEGNFRRRGGPERPFASRGGKRPLQFAKSMDLPPREHPQRSHGKDFKPKPFAKEAADRKFTPHQKNQSADTGDLHPSWQAKKKLQMQCSIVPSQAKRIKFD